MLPFSMLELVLYSLFQNAFVAITIGVQTKQGTNELRVSICHFVDSSSCLWGEYKTWGGGSEQLAKWRIAGTLSDANRGCDYLFTSSKQTLAWQPSATGKSNSGDLSQVQKCHKWTEHLKLSQLISGFHQEECKHTIYLQFLKLNGWSIILIMVLVCVCLGENESIKNVMFGT